MDHPNFVKISNIWHNHPSSLHKPLSILATHEITTIESPCTTKLDKPKVFASTRSSKRATTLALIAKPSPTSLEYALIIEFQWSLIRPPIPSCLGVPKAHPSKFNLMILSVGTNHTCEVFLTNLLDLHTSYQSNNIRLKGVPSKALLV